MINRLFESNNKFDSFEELLLDSLHPVGVDPSNPVPILKIFQSRLVIDPQTMLPTPRNLDFTKIMRTVGPRRMINIQDSIRWIPKQAVDKKCSIIGRPPPSTLTACPTEATNHHLVPLTSNLYLDSHDTDSNTTSKDSLVCGMPGLHITDEDLIKLWPKPRGIIATYPMGYCLEKASPKAFEYIMKML